MIALPSVVVRVWRLAAIASCVMTGATPSVAEVSYLTQSRSVQARAVFSYSDVAARDFGPFDQRVEAGGIPEVHRGSRGTAWQLSTLSPDRIDVMGSTSALGGWQAASGEGLSEFDVTFAVDVPTRFSLFGFWEADTGGTALSDIAVEFSGPSGNIFSDGSRANPFEWRPIVDYALEGLITPGTYRLRAHSGSLAGGMDGNSGEFGLRLDLSSSEASCGSTWDWGTPSQQPDGTVLSLAEWDGDGPGGHPPLLVAGGEFTAAGTIAANRIAAWSHETQTWTPLGAGLNGEVRCLLAMRDGSLVAGGAFSVAGDVAAAHVARWNGTSWTPLGGGSTAPVDALVQLPDGSLVASGGFPTSVPGVVARVGRWDGAGWSPLGFDELTNGRVMALAVHRDGRIVAGGDFYFLDPEGNVLSCCVAAWDGTRWEPIGDEMSTATFSLATTPEGDVVSGDLNAAVRRWNGSSWSTVPRTSGMSSSIVYSVAVARTGEIYAAGDFDFQQPCCDDPWRFPVLRWDGASWTKLGEGLNQTVRALMVDSSGHLNAGGSFTYSSAEPYEHLARWNGLAWRPVMADSGFDGSVLAIAHDSSGTDESVIVGGEFSRASGPPIANIARRHAGRIEPLGGTINGTVRALIRMPGGDLVAAGLFTVAGDVEARSIARWDGVSWSPLGPGLDGGVFALAVLPDGRLIAGGAFTGSGGVPLGRGLAAWDGVAWSSVDGGVNSNGWVNSLAVTPQGHLVVGGHFRSIGGVSIGSGIARRDGATWHPLGLGVEGDVHALLAVEGDSIIAGGDFTIAGSAAVSLARWDGSAWSDVGGGIGIGSSRLVRSLALTPDGTLVAGGHFRTAGDRVTPFLAEWDGVDWSTPAPALNGPVLAMTTLPDGAVAVGGSFSGAGRLSLEHLARLRRAELPSILEQPQDAYACRSEHARLEATASDAMLHWEVELAPRFSNQWIRLTDGPLPSSALSGAIVSGTDTRAISLSRLDPAAALRYRVVASNACGTSTSIAATLGFCPGDHNCDGGVDGSDVNSFFDAWERGLSDGDIDQDGAVDGRDVEKFFEHWDAGC